MSLSRTHRNERGSALMLMPAAVLIVFLLGSIALDFSIIYLRQRQALNLAADAANDAAIEGIDLATFRTEGTTILVDGDGLEAVEARFEQLATFGDAVDVELVVVDDVTVTAVVRVDYGLVFAGIVPGADRHRSIEARATAVAEESG